jgi:hypothetical protein
MNRRTSRSLLIAPFACILWSLLVVSPVQAEQNRWGFGSDLGFTSGTVNGTVFTLGFNLDYYVDRNFSFGPMMLLSPAGDLTQVAFAGVGKYHIRLNNGINIVPFTGFGLIHADLNRGTGPGSVDANDTSWYVPIGLSLEYQVLHNIAISSTLMVNLYKINLSPSLPDPDTNSVTLLFGIRFGP